jgi:hypothetical protein
MEQNIPDFENGYYLASYKCVCKANYEFPFIDYGSSYFEGGTVEKEYDKKVKGKSNIYDRLKCRPINLRDPYGKQYSKSNILKGEYYLAIFFIITMQSI